MALAAGMLKWGGGPWDLIEVAPDALIATNAAGNIVFANAQAARLFGYSRAELENLLLEALLPPRFHAQHRQHLADFLANPGERLMGVGPDLVGRRQNGEEFPLEIALSSVEIVGTRLALAAIRDLTKRQQVEDELRRSQREVARMQGQLDCAPITIVRVDRHAHITHVNNAWRRFARENAANDATIAGVGLNYLDAARGICEEGAGAVGHALEALVAGRRERFDGIYACHSPSELRWFHLEARRLDADDAVVLMHTNVTELRLARARVRVQSVVAAALAQNVPLLAACRSMMQATAEGHAWDFAAVWLPEQSVRLRCADVWVRPGLEQTAFERVTRARDVAHGCDLPGRTWQSGATEWIRDVTADPNFPRAPLALAAGLRMGLAVPLQCDGEVLAVVEFYGAVQRSPDLELTALLETAGLQLGAKEQRARAKLRADQAEVAERSTRAQLDAVLESAPGFIIAVNSAGRIQFINRLLSGHVLEEVIGSNWLDYLPAQQHEQMTLRLGSVLETGVPQVYEVKIQGPGGRELQFLSHMGPMRREGSIVGAVINSQEVTELKRTQEEFFAARRWAAVGTLAAGVAHEINTPIQFVNDSLHFLRDGYRYILELLQPLQTLHRLTLEGAPSAQLQSAVVSASKAQEKARLPYFQEHMPKAFDACTVGLDRVASIVRSIREFASPDQARMAPVALNPAILNTLAIAKSEYKYVADLATELGELPLVMCDVNDIKQVLLDLIINAAQAIGEAVQGTGKRGKLNVTSRCDGEWVTILVRDTGVGIPEAIRHRVFEAFFTTKDVGKGIGQGLARAWTVVEEKHGGTLSFESKVGEGTTFLVRLPIAGKASSATLAG